MPKISALTSLAQASVDTAADVLPIVDATAPATTKKVTVQALVNAGLATLTTLPSGIVNASLNSIVPYGGAALYVGDGTQTQVVIARGPGSGVNNGAAFIVQNGGVPVIALGNKSALLGGAYDATPMLYGNAPIEVNQALNVTGFISVIGSMGWIDVNDSRAAGVGVGGSLFLRGKDDNGDYQDFAGINAFLTDGTVGAVGADLIFKTRLSGTLAERMRLLASGDLLINQTTNPSSYKLAVTGNVGVTGAINATGTIASSNALETLNSGSLYQYNAGSTTFFRSRNDGNNLDVSYNGGGVITRTNTSGFAVTGSISATKNITSAGNIIQVGAAGTGTGGNYRITDDGGTLRWLAGLLGTAGARDWTLLEVVSGRTPIRANASTGAVSIDHGLSVTGLTTTDTLRVNVTPTAETPTATHTAVFNINGTNYKFLCLAA